MHFFYRVACKVAYITIQPLPNCHTTYLFFQCIPLSFRLKCVCFHGAAMPRARTHTRSRSPSPDDYPSHFEQIRRWRLHGFVMMDARGTVAHSGEAAGSSGPAYASNPAGWKPSWTRDLGDVKEYECKSCQATVTGMCPVNCPICNVDGSWRLLPPKKRSADDLMEDTSWNTGRATTSAGWKRVKQGH